MKKRKLIVVLGFVVSIFVVSLCVNSAANAQGKDVPNGKGFQALQDQIQVLQDQIDNIGTSIPIIWSGGSKSDGRAKGWNVYKNDGVDFNSATDYIQADGEGAFNFLQDGYYRINYWGTSLAADRSNSSSVIKLVRNDKDFFYFSHTPNLIYRYDSMHADQTWRFHADDNLKIYIHNPGQFAYRSYGPRSRVQISYEGPLE